MPLLTDPVLVSGALANLPHPVLTGDGLTLRPWRPADAPAVRAAYADPGIQRWHARSMTAAEARAWITSWPARWELESGAGWAVTDDSGVLGQISLRRLHLAEAFAEISYWVLPAARGRRVATRALATLTAWCFGELGLHRLEVEHSTLNTASCGVAVAAGFPAEGTKRAGALHADGWHDMHLHARLADDPRPKE
ncbi:GNAT family N-acetyltransferase [Longispora urticae]